MAATLAVVLVMSAWIAGVYHPSIGIDDANIFIGYGAHLAAGHGFVYDPGGEPVEGTSSLLWTLAAAAAHFLPSRVETTLTAVSHLLAAATVLMALRLARIGAPAAGVPADAAALATAAAFLLHPSFFLWTAWSLMDTALTAALFTLALLSAALAAPAIASGRRPPAAALAGLAVVAALLPLARPEGPALALGLVGLPLAASLAAGRRPDRTLLHPPALAALVSAAVTAWRLDTFGQPLPNPVYAKVSTGLADQMRIGADYVLRGLLDPAVGLPVAAVAAGAVIVAAGRGARSVGVATRARLLMAAGATCCLLLPVVLAGGDTFSNHRFLQPLVPLAAVVAGITVARLAGRATASPVAACLAILFAAVPILAPRAVAFQRQEPELGQNFRIAEHGRAVGDALNALDPPPRIGIIAAGGIRVTYRGRIADLVGLNWPEMAHAVGDIPAAVRGHAFSPEVFWRDPPDLVMPRFGPCVPEPAWNWFETMVLGGLDRDPAFRAAYLPACHGGLVFHLRRDALGRWPGMVLPR